MRSARFTPSTHFPQRRRVTQACVNCRLRKTRCDAAQPKCSLCALQNVDCVYRDAQQLRIDHNTKVLLDRIEILEERLLSSLPSQGRTLSPPAATSEQRDSLGDPSPFDLQIPLSHTANANHVFSWPIVRQLLSESPDFQNWQSGDATDVFFEGNLHSATGMVPPPSWRLMENQQFPFTAVEYYELLEVYFSKINVYFPLLSMQECVTILDHVLAFESNVDEHLYVRESQYALILMVLCLASFVKDRDAQTTVLMGGDLSRVEPEPSQKSQMHYHLWGKAKLCLGWLNSSISIQAAQSSMLASIYLGARGDVAESFFWTHSTAVKVETIARSYSTKSETVPQSFRQLYWITFIYEGDFVSEISITLPSGVTRYEDVIPYPDPHTRLPHLTTDHETESPPIHQPQEELFAFQISTNSAIRRFLNRVNSVVYDNKEQYRAARPSYASWLLRISNDLWSHHEALYQNLPDLLLTSQPEQLPRIDDSLMLNDNEAPSLNKPWNVIRLRGRYYAGQYIIHRPFIEFALLNMATFDSHPCRDDILRKGRMCLDGCQGFIELFGGQPANSITGLFAPGIVIFTMTLILMIASTCSIFNDIIPASLESTINVGKDILRRFSTILDKFSWHLNILQAIDQTRKSKLNMG